MERETRQRVQEANRHRGLAVGTPSMISSAPFLEFVLVGGYLDALQADVIDNTTVRSSEEQPVRLPSAGTSPEKAYERYRVNLVWTTQDPGRPACRERSEPHLPQPHRTHRAPLGARRIDHDLLMSKRSPAPGNGGYLVVDGVRCSPRHSPGRTEARPERWRVDIEERPSSTPDLHRDLEPEAHPPSVKGDDRRAVRLLAAAPAGSPTFPASFKVLSDFDAQMDGLRRTAIGTRVSSPPSRPTGLAPFDASAVGKIVEYGVREVSDQDKLSARFEEVADLVREAAYWARSRQVETVTAADVQRAVEEKVYRSRRIEERIREAITRGMIRVDTAGVVVGQVNGLSVITLGGYEFGRPRRITCRLRGAAATREHRARVRDERAAPQQGFLI